MPVVILCAMGKQKRQDKAMFKKLLAQTKKRAELETEKVHNPLAMKPKKKKKKGDKSEGGGHKSEGGGHKSDAGSVAGRE